MERSTLAGRKGVKLLMLFRVEFPCPRAHRFAEMSSPYMLLPQAVTAIPLPARSNYRKMAFNGLCEAVLTQSFARPPEFRR
ncbi:unnamed protein product [Protopolystoma xenopodis]|uniref:Uncharacterized protein n=1 Tax=Protopolystoma xenopodis TaxID=117903 RepID=A0A3S5APR3_9PLAT|nr:unnamed protein product [Protopolystoma xenopodis]